MDKPVYVDPPSGWRYGFPKLWDRKTPLVRWLVENGYPKDMAKKASHVRFIATS